MRNLYLQKKKIESDSLTYSTKVRQVSNLNLEIDSSLIK